MKLQDYSKGFSFDEFEKDETVYVFYSERPIDEPKLYRGTIIRLHRANNAQGKDVIRRVEIDLCNEEGVKMHTHSICGFNHIRNQIYRKNIQEDKVVVSEVVCKESSSFETLVVERAMSDKNPTVKRYLEEGWNFVSRIWSSEKNMYLATLERPTA